MLIIRNVLFVTLTLPTLVVLSIPLQSIAPSTKVSIEGTNFLINDELTYKHAQNPKVHGLLINSRMVNAIFDTETENYDDYFAYPDTKVWDPFRNTNEFIGNLTNYKEYGLLSFTVGLQGGNPFSYSTWEPDEFHKKQVWENSAFHLETGEIKADYLDRLELILKKTDELGMIPIVELFYPGQANKMTTSAQKIALDHALDWLKATPYNHILLEVVNEYDHIDNPESILHEDHIADTMSYIKEYTNHRFLLGASLNGGYTPNDDVIRNCDMIMLHGNYVRKEEFSNMLQTIFTNPYYINNPKPVIINEDDTYDFSLETTATSTAAATATTEAHHHHRSRGNHYDTCIQHHVSWGIFFSCRRGDYKNGHGYQCIPVNWDVSTHRKKTFFSLTQAYVS